MLVVSHASSGALVGLVAAGYMPQLVGAHPGVGAVFT